MLRAVTAKLAVPTPMAIFLIVGLFMKGILPTMPFLEPLRLLVLRDDREAALRGLDLDLL